MKTFPNGLDDGLKTLEGEALPRRLPELAPANCPQCGAELYRLDVLSLRAALLRELETHSSKEPTATLALALKVRDATEPLELEDAEAKLLEAAVKGNGARWPDVIVARLLEYVDGAEKAVD